jgi:hypothetical protein
MTATESEQQRDQVIQEHNFKDIPAKDLARLRRGLQSYASDCLAHERYQQAHQVVTARRELDKEIARQEALIQELNQRMIVSEGFNRRPPAEYFSTREFPRNFAKSSDWPNTRSDPDLAEFDADTEKQDLAIDKRHRAEREAFNQEWAEDTPVTRRRISDSERARIRLLKRQELEKQTFIETRNIERRRLQERIRVARAHRRASAARIPGQIATEQTHFRPGARFQCCRPASA